jgi:hypothetical protein
MVDGAFEQRFEESGALGIGDAPADDPSAKNVDDHVEIEVGPFGRSHQLADIPVLISTEI